MEGTDEEEAGQAFARRHDPETSKEAAETVAGDMACRLEKMVLAALEDLGGEATPYQVTLHIQKTKPSIDSNTITPRFRPLERKKLIHRTGERGPGRGNHTQEVWKLGDDPMFDKDDEQGGQTEWLL